MEPHERITVGIDVAEARRGLDLVAMDHDRVVVAVHSRLTIEQAARLVMEDIQPAVVCIDSPAQWSTWGNSREAERALSRLGINAFRTPAGDRAGPFHTWMRVGFELYEALAPRYPRYRGGIVIGTAAEYFPHASVALLAGDIAALKDKRRVRRRVLEENGVATALLATIDQLDAALGALTGHIALAGPVCWVGDAEEGALLLPGPVPAERLPRAETLRSISTGVPSILPFGTAAVDQTRSPDRTCGCGCGAAVRREFLPGHDAKLRSRLLREARLGQSAVEEPQRRHGL